MESRSPAFARQILNHWTTREAPEVSSPVAECHPSSHQWVLRDEKREDISGCCLEI